MLDMDVVLEAWVSGLIELNKLEWMLGAGEAWKDEPVGYQEFPKMLNHEGREVIVNSREEEEAALHPAAKVEVKRILLAEPLTPTPSGARLTEVLCRQASRVMGETIAASGVPLYTDARHYAKAGVPIVLYGAGPRTIEEANAHRADERLPLSDLYKATEVIALTLAELLQETEPSG